MNSFESIAYELEKQGKGDELKRLADSEDGRRIGRMIDADRLKRAAQSGDAAALQDMLKAVLSTAEGKQLAENVRKMLGK